MWIVFRIFEIRIINEYFLGIMTNKYTHFVSKENVEHLKTSIYENSRTQYL